MTDAFPDSTRCLVRLAPEITTKSRRTRKRFQRVLCENIRDALRSLDAPYDVDPRWTRILVESGSPDAPELMADLFGVSSVSPLDACIPADLDTIVQTGTDLYSEMVKEARTFAVDARRHGDQDFRSQDVRVQLGAALNRHCEVDLDHPDVTVYVEVRDEEAFLFSHRIDGPGGLPAGVEGKAVCLISGGFDSAAAAWLVSKRGVALDYVFCNLAGAAYERSVATVAKVLADRWSFGLRPRLHVVDFEEVVAGLQDAVTPRYWQVVLKRLMYRTAELVAARIEAEAIVTGESLGQVSSQTLGNLRSIDAVAGLPVFRPLLGYDKNDIIALAERVGTGALSARVKEYCAILPDRPVTAAKPHAVDDEESRLDLSLLERVVADRKVLDLRELTAAELVEPYVFTSEVPEGAVVIDCRSAHQYRAWHYPGARHASPRELTHDLKKLDRDATYVLYCEAGVQTAPLAEIMQRVGYEAYSFRGGTRALKRWLEERKEAVPAS